MAKTKVLLSHGITTSTWDPLCCDHRCDHLATERNTKPCCDLFQWMLKPADSKKPKRLQRCKSCIEAQRIFNNLATAFNALKD